MLAYLASDVLVDNLAFAPALESGDNGNTSKILEDGRRREIRGLGNSLRVAVSK